LGISPHEQYQFENIVAGFDIADNSLAKRMEKRAKASEMTFTPLPHLPTFRVIMCYLFLLCSVACSPVSFFLIKDDISLSLMVLMLAPILLVCAYKVKPQTFSR